MGGRNCEIPPLLTLFFLLRSVEAALRPLFGSKRWFYWCDLSGKQCQTGSLAGAAHLLNDNAGVLRVAQREQKSRVEQKGKSDLDSGTFTST